MVIIKLFIASLGCYLMRRLLINYQNKLVGVSASKDTPRSRIAKKYKPPLTPLMEEDREYISTT
jgi:hypothetical protein